MTAAIMFTASRERTERTDSSELLVALLVDQEKVLLKRFLELCFMRPVPTTSKPHVFHSTTSLLLPSFLRRAAL